MQTQQDAIDAIQEGKNVFLTGGAGVGKSHVIRQVVDNSTVLVSPTGVAALNIGGATAHSTFGLPFGLVTDKDKEKVSNRCFDIFKEDSITTLVIDEISILRADYLDVIDHKLRFIKQNHLPFGGLQVVVVGDFYQLPPIIQSNEKRYYRRMYKSPYAFDSEVWKAANFYPVVLEKVYRQSEADQIALLNHIRCKGKYWKQAVDRLNEWCDRPGPEEPLTLCNYIKDADKINQTFYKRINTSEQLYRGKLTGTFKEKECAVDPNLKLKEGCKVVICANNNEGGYRNGQRGTVLSLYEDSVLVELENNGQQVLVEEHKWEKFGYSKLMGSVTKTTDGTFKQLPLRLGWAITVHKAQGMTLDNCSLHLGRKTFAPHQLYVGLSRIRDLKNMTLVRPIEYSDVIVDDKVVKFYESLGV